MAGIELIDKITPKNGGAFAMVMAKDVEMTEGGVRLPEYLEGIKGGTVKNAETAAKLAAARLVSIAGGATAAGVGFDGSADITLTVTSLDATKLVGKVPAASLPALDYILTSEKGANNGVATLDSNGKLTASQTPLGLDDFITVSKLPTENQDVNVFYYVQDGAGEGEDPATTGTAGHTYRWSGEGWHDISAADTADKAVHDGAGNDITATYETKADATTALNGKVDKVDGKSLSTNDFTNDYKTKLDGLHNSNNTYTATGTITGGTATAISSVTVPEGKTLAVGDLVIDQAGNVFAVESMESENFTPSAAAVLSLKGPQGEKGEAGKNGARGSFTFIAGVNVQSDSDVNKTDLTIPDGMAPAAGDMVLDTNGDTYFITAVAADTVHVGHATAVNLKGPKGDKGDTPEIKVGAYLSKAEDGTISVNASDIVVEATEEEILATLND